MNRRQAKIKQVAENRQAGFVVVLEDIHDPHNAAAILRTCDAFGIQDVWFIFDKEKAYNPKRVGKSSSSSTNKWLTFRIFKSVAECKAALKKFKYESIGTVLHSQAKDFTKAKLTAKRIALWVGNEHAGLSESAIAACDRLLKLPMRGFVESLNVSVMAAICIYEISRQRQKQQKWFHLNAKSAQKLERDFGNR
ncbi:RNA methyltransferase [Candidatus Parcubacteria bacterium]|jgi:tRNA (guanosine-2'-O-)-methyltransferase|nr:MAG: RNA methyltransferase [Candidatus Parcubacteria bacterium]